MPVTRAFLGVPYIFVAEGWSSLDEGEWAKQGGVVLSPYTPFFRLVTTGGVRYQVNYQKTGAIFTVSAGALDAHLIPLDVDQGQARAYTVGLLFHEVHRWRLHILQGTLRSKFVRGATDQPTITSLTFDCRTEQIYTRDHPVQETCINAAQSFNESILGISEILEGVCNPGNDSNTVSQKDEDADALEVETDGKS